MKNNKGEAEISVEIGGHEGPRWDGMRIQAWNGR